MKDSNNSYTLEVETTTYKCPIGEKKGKQNILEGNTPVLSCEGACIRGEIARLAANEIAMKDGFARGCHGELFSVPNSAIATWIKEARRVVMIDGCFLKCHERILKNIIDESKIIHFDALSHHKKYSDIFDIHKVPQQEREHVAHDVAEWAANNLDKPVNSVETENNSCSCGCK